MTEHYQTDPMTQLDTLDNLLSQGLAQLPTLRSVVEQRFRDAMPTPLAEVPLEQLYLGGKSLIQHLCAVARGASLVEGLIQRRLPNGFAPISEQEHHWARRFLERTGHDLKQLHLDGLTRFWAVVRVSGKPARQWLIELCREHLRSQARLRHADRTLGEVAYRQLLDVLGGATAAPTWKGAVTLHSGYARWVLPGAFVVCRLDPRRSLAEPVVLSTWTHGLETFESLQALYQELGERLEDDRQGAALLASLDPERQSASLRCNGLTFEPISGDLLVFLQLSLERRQHAVVRHAWAHAEKYLQQDDLGSASDVLAGAANPYALLSSQGPRLTRYMLLLERDMPAWMTRMSQPQRLELLQGMRELGLATANAIAPGLPSAREFADPQWLRQYAHDQLTQLLEPLGITLSPERILISVTSSDPGGPLVNPLHPSGSVPARVSGHTSSSVILTTQTRTLVQLAIENISPLDWDYFLTARVRDDAGRPIPGLSPAKVRQLVRRANVGGEYGRYLLRRLRYGPEAEWRRERHARLLRAKLQVETLKARYREQLGPGGQAGSWISAVLEAPSPALRRRVGGQAVGVWQLFIRNTPIDGVYLFGPVGSTSAQPVALYTPGSPLRQSWRWFKNRQAVATQWLNDPATKPYIVQRVALAERGAIEALLGTPALASHVAARPVSHNFFDNAYRSETRLVMANADALSASNRELNLQAIAEVAVTLTEIVCLVLPSRVAGVLSLSRAIWSFLQAYLAVGEESESVVLLHAFDGYANLFEATVALSTSPLFGKLARRLPLGAPVPLHTHYAIKQQRVYLRYRLVTDYAEGVYEAQGMEGGASQYFITDRDGRQYEVLNDGEHWRVVDARMPHARYKPIVRRNREGNWEMVDEIRWRGPVPDIPALLQRVRLPDPPAGVSPGLPSVINGQHYLRIGESVLAVRPSLLPGRYTVLIPPTQQPEAVLTVLFRHDPARGWEAKVRQSDLSSEWFELG
ncbi:DUF6543 domain-containing protein [Pseudomonas sp. RIT-PI-S]|uniref:dermonecrotic toxin domain-containing protein n=1 Tax=Pseudomonas sp. RIT-PI-S TaxID=3035295 RepID=UPI0021DB2C6C|nr:DUF6543 domain-containing protein [Pseudomonas sp. RIT-PI-S]